MSKEKTLLIMAAGMGSRFGGLKQIEPVGPNGEFILDYSIYDAMRSGFTKVVFIIKEENYELFKETVGNRIGNNIKVEYTFQDINDIPEEYKGKTSREKPWGTGHAILSARNVINENFAVINADDFYGRDAYEKLSKSLDEANDSNWSLIGYIAANTLAEAGSVKRGICEANIDKLTNIIESNVERENGVIMARPLDGRESFHVSDDSYVSMNMWGFSPKLFEYLGNEFPKFMKENENNLDKCEFLLPDIIEHLVKQDKVNVKIVPTTSVWMGITYKEDKEEVVNELKRLTEEGLYPSNLWN